MKSVSSSVNLYSSSKSIKYWPLKARAVPLMIAAIWSWSSSCWPPAFGAIRPPPPPPCSMLSFPGRFPRRCSRSCGSPCPRRGHRSGTCSPSCDRRGQLPGNGLLHQDRGDFALVTASDGYGSGIFARFRRFLIRLPWIARLFNPAGSSLFSGASRSAGPGISSGIAPACCKASSSGRMAISFVFPEPSVMTPGASPPSSMTMGGPL